MKIRTLGLLAVAAALLPAAQCDQVPGFTQDVPLDTAFFTNKYTGAPLQELNKVLTVGIGSGAYHRKGDAPHVVYTITDRGANIDAEDAPLAPFIGFQPIPGTSPKGKIFPLPNFSPSIYKLKVGLGSFEVLEILQIKDADGQPLPGVSVPALEQGYNGAGEALAGHPEAVDSEALVRLSDGTFWAASEYGPDLIHINGDGRILDRLVPAGSVIPGTPALADYYNKRRLNRGFESLGVSPDESKLYTIIQSPLELASNAAGGRDSRNLRLLVIDRAGKTVLREHIYVEDLPTTYAADVAEFASRGATVRQRDVKVSELVAVGDDVLLILERVTLTTKLFVVKLAGATNTYGTPISQIEATSTPVAFTPVSKTLVFDSDVHAPGLAAKIEGVAHLGGGHFLLINDNDFGTEGGASTQLFKIFIQPSLLH